MNFLAKFEKCISESSLEHYRRRANNPLVVDYENIKNIVVISNEGGSIETFTGSEIEEVVEWMIWRTVGDDESSPEITVFCSSSFRTQIHSLYFDELGKIYAGIPGLIAQKKADYAAQVQRDAELSAKLQEQSEKEIYLRLKEKFGPRGLEKKLEKLIETHAGGRACLYCGAVENEICESGCIVGELRELL